MAYYMSDNVNLMAMNKPLERVLKIKFSQWKSKKK